MGNGVEHITVNKAQNGTFTSTFTGTATITLYPPGSVTPDSHGNPTITGPRDVNVLPVTGKITESFGVSFNKQSLVLHSTFHFSGADATGQAITVHVVSHANWTPHTDPSGPPHRSFDKVRCS